MSILMSVPLVTSCSNQLKLSSLNLYRSASAKHSTVDWKAPWAVTIWKDKALTLEHLRVSSHTTRHFRGHSFTDMGTFSFDWGDREFEDTNDLDLDSPWEGAIIYKRSSLVTHLEYCTTLERLGLEKLSTNVSRKHSSAMGIRVTNDVKDFPNGTPVQISVDVSRKKKKLRLDGIIRTVLTLGCNRCGEPAAESVYTNFSLVLTEEPIEEPKVIDLGTIYGDEKTKSSIANNREEDDEVSIDPDDWLYFPPEEKEIDISKNIRDLVHVEITINAVCDPSCKGMCLQCGTNLNISICKCKKEPVDDKVKGPLGNLKKHITTN